MSMDTNQAMALRDQLLTKLAGEHQNSLLCIEHLPEGKIGYSPHADLRPFGELMHHVYSSGMWFAGIMQSGKVEMSGDAPKPSIPTTNKALAEACTALNEQLIKTTQALTGEQLAKPVAFFDFGTFPAITFLDWHVSHMIHHRGQLTVYLRMMGAKVPAIYGDSKDYPFNM